MIDRKSLLSSAAVDAGKTHTIAVGQVTYDRLRAHRRLGESDNQTLERVVGATERMVRFAGADIALADLQRIVGRSIALDPAGAPILNSYEKQLADVTSEVRKELLENPRLSDGAKARILQQMRAMFAGKIPKSELLSKLQGRISGEEIIADVGPWLKSDLKLGRANGSMLHRLREAWRAGAVHIPATFDSTLHLSLDSKTIAYFMATEPHTFVVQHDWHAAFRGAGDFDTGEIRLPFEHCAFEFHISGRRVIALGGAGGNAMTLFCASDDRWMVAWQYGWQDGWLVRVHAPPDPDGLIVAFDAVAAIVGDSIRSVCICLEAEVAKTEVVRAPHRHQSSA